MQNQSYTLITGASAGIGQACAKLLAKEGRNLILVARREERLVELKEKLEAENGISVLTHKVDLSKISEIEAFFGAIQDKEVQALINNAGLATGVDSFEDFPWQDFETMIDVNIKGMTRMAQLSIPFLKKTKGHIVNISSIAGAEAYEGGSVYCGSKAFVKMISRALRIDLAGTGIRVTDIAPGNVETEFSIVRFKGDKEKAKAKYAGYTPLCAEDVAETICFALNRPKHVNLQEILIMPTAQASAKRVMKNS